MSVDSNDNIVDTSAEAEDQNHVDVDEDEDAEATDVGISQAVITIALFVAFLSFIVVCLPLYFFNWLGGRARTGPLRRRAHCGGSGRIRMMMPSTMAQTTSAITSP